MKNRKELAKYFKELGFKVGAEVGVAQGYYSEVLCQENSDLKLYCIDYWEYYKEYIDYRKKSTFNNLYEEAVTRLKPYDCILIKKRSMDAVKDFKDESLDFVYIDAHHGYEYIKEDIEEWSKKVKKKGIVSGHDYYKMPSGNVGVIKAVDEYVKKNNYKLIVMPWDKENPCDDNRCPGWYFIKICQS